MFKLLRSAIATVTVLVPAMPAPQVSAASNPADPHWLKVVNDYRAQSGLPAVVESRAMSRNDYLHSCWMLHNGIAHDEVPGTPLYTAGGDQAGNASNVATSSGFDSTPKTMVDLWMSGPYHAIGILRTGVTTMGYGECHSSTAPRPGTAASLNVISGLTNVARKTPVTFPGNGATTRLSRFIAEFPNPLTPCGYSTAGLPLVALMPESVTSATSSLAGPFGPVTVCTLRKGLTGNQTADSLLGGENGVIVVPSAKLADGRYTATVRTNARTVTWSFTVNTTTPASTSSALTATTFPAGGFVPFGPKRVADSRTRTGLTTGRLAANIAQQVVLTGLPSGTSAVTANVAAVNPASAGQVTVWACDVPRPGVPTINVQPGVTQSTNITVPVGATGRLCAISTQPTDVTIDVTGAIAPAGKRLTLVQGRAYDSRLVKARMVAGSTRRIVVAGRAGVPAGSSAAALHVTAVTPSSAGSITVYPCSATVPGIVSATYQAGANKAATIHTALAADGSVCVFTSQAADIIVDVAGFYGSTGLATTPTEALRMVDTRDKNNNALTAGTAALGLVSNYRTEVKVVAGKVLPSATAVTFNVTTVGSTGGGHVKVWDCQSGVPSTSVMNYPAKVPSSASVTVATKQTGSVRTFCIMSSTDTHVVIDLVATHA